MTMEEFVTLGDLITIGLFVVAIVGLIISNRKNGRSTKDGSDKFTEINEALKNLKKGQYELKSDIKEIKKSSDEMHINCAKTVATFSEQIKTLYNRMIN